MFLLGKRDDPEKKPLDPTGLFLNFVASAPGAALYILFPPESPAEDRLYTKRDLEKMVKKHPSKTHTHNMSYQWSNSHPSTIIHGMAI